MIDTHTQKHEKRWWVDLTKKTKMTQKERETSERRENGLRSTLKNKVASKDILYGYGSRILRERYES